MISLACRHIAPNCLDTLTADNDTLIQKVFLDHVHAKHALQWSQFSRQFKSASIVTMRNRFRHEEAQSPQAAVVGTSS